MLLLISVPPLLISLVAAQVALLLIGAAIAATVALLSPRIPMLAFYLAVVLASFVNYGAGNLARDIGVILAILLLGVLGLAPAAKRGVWRELPGGVAIAFFLWGCQLALGFVIGTLAGNSTRFSLLELSAACWPLLAILFAQALDPKRLELWLALLLAVGMAHVAFGIGSLIVHQQRLGGVYFTAIPGYACVGAVAMYLLSTSPWVRRVALVSVPLLASHVFFSFSRGYWFGLIVGLAVLLFLLLRKESHQKLAEPRAIWLRLLALTTAVTVSAVVLIQGFGSMGLGSGASERFASAFDLRFSGETASNLYRLIEYEAALREAIQAPIFGRGLGATAVMVDPLLKTRTEEWYIHNYFIYLFLKFGAVGVFVFIFLIWRLVRYSLGLTVAANRPEVRALGYVGAAILAQVLVISLTHYPLADVNSAYYLALLIGLLMTLDGRRTFHGRGQNEESSPGR